MGTSALYNPIQFFVRPPMDPQSLEPAQKNQFQIADLVWSKIPGYPWWPATIIQQVPPPSPKYKVKFLADNTYSYLPSNKLIHYDEGKAKYQERSRSYKGLKKAIGCAERVRGRSLRNLGGSCLKNVKVIPYKQIQILNEEIIKGGSEINIQQIKRCLEQNQKGSRTQSSKPNQELTRVNQVITKPKKQRKLNLANSLLARYKLIDIPPIQEERSHQLSKNHKLCQKHQQPPTISEDALRIKFIRKINEILRKKELSSPSVSQKISIHLADSIINKRKQGSKAIHSDLFQWINCSDRRIIENSYLNWEESHEKQNTVLPENVQTAFKKSLEEIK